MNKSLLLLLGLVLAGIQANAQSISSVSVSPSGALACSTLTVTTNGSLNCANAILDSSSHTIVGTTVFVNIYITQPFICLPAIVPFSRTHTIPGGTIPPGNYTLTVRTFLNLTQFTSSNSALNLPTCCSASSSFSLSRVNICVGDTASFLASDTTLSSYVWRNNGTQFSTTPSGAQAFTATGAYAISLTTSNGTCSTTTTQTLNVFGFPTTSISQVTPESCPGRNDGAVDLSVTGGTAPYRYLWSNGASTQDVTGLAGGTYLVTVTDTNGCSVQDSASVLTGLAATAAFSTAPGTLICQGDTAFFTNTSTGATNYNWLLNGQPLSQLPDFDYAFTSAGTYSVSLIANNATCFDTLTQSIRASAPPAVSGAASQTSCPASSDGGILLSVSGGISPYTYLWSNGDTTRDLNNAAAGPYTVTVTDSLGCAGTETFTVPAGQGFSASFSANTPTSVCPGTTVNFINTSNGGTNFLWYSNGMPIGQTADITYTFDLPGTYRIIMVGNDGVCFDSAGLTMTVFTLPRLTANLTQETCPEDANGAIDLMLSGGTAPFAYNWSTGANTQNLSGLGAGSYQLTVVDGNGCTIRDTFDILTLGGLNASFSQVNLGGGSYQFNDLSDTTAVSWLWDFGDGMNSSTQQNPRFTYNFSGNYRVCLVATDRYGCSDSTCQLLDISVGLSREQLAGMSLYPNPGTGICRIVLPDLMGKEVEVEFHDAWGRNVLRQRSVMDERLELSVTDLPSGVYMIWLRHDEGAYFGKWVKR